MHCRLGRNIRGTGIVRRAEINTSALIAPEATSSLTRAGSDPKVRCEQSQIVPRSVVIAHHLRRVNCRPDLSLKNPQIEGESGSSYCVIWNHPFGPKQNPLHRALTAYIPCFRPSSNLYRRLRRYSIPPDRHRLLPTTAL